MDMFYVLIDNQQVYIVSLNTCYRPVITFLPNEIKVGMKEGNVETFDTLEDVQKYLYNRIGFNEIYKLGLNNGLGDWVNKPINRISKKK